MSSTIARILKVNHGGEHGAIRIYAAQIAAARLRCPSLTPELADLLEHERRHERMFLALMPDRDARPCRLMWLWGIGGGVLGFSTGLLGRGAIFICTRAVEQTVHRHLTEQLDWLASRPDRADDAVAGAIREIQAEEVGHLAWASDRAPGGAAAGALDGVISWIVEALIWVSTQGESARLHREIGRA